MNDKFFWFHMIMQKEREAYEVIIKDGKFYYKCSRQLLDTTQSLKGTKWIFVLSTSKAMYVGQVKSHLHKITDGSNTSYRF